MDPFDVIVIGQGYAGLSAARLAAQRGLRTASCESECMGGLVLNINELDPAPPGEANSGAEISSELLSQAMELGVEVGGAVTQIERNEGGLWAVKTDYDAFTGRNLVIASGARLRELGVPGEAELYGRGVSRCADCDGPLYSNRETVVVGGGDSAFQEALALSHFASKITIVMTGVGPTARADLVERAAADPKIVLAPRSEVRSILGDAANGVEGVVVETAGEGERTLPCSGVFVFIGLKPNSELLPAEVSRDAAGGVITASDRGAGLPGLWAVGAVRSGFGGLLSDAAKDAEIAVAALV